jgi:spoIIIJ-associated protein
MGLDDSVVVTAPSVEEAVIVGLTRLVATRDEVDIEVLDEGSRGFLGIGIREARVRLTRGRDTEGVAVAKGVPELAAGYVSPGGEAKASEVTSDLTVRTSSVAVEPPRPPVPTPQPKQVVREAETSPRVEAETRQMAQQSARGADAGASEALDRQRLSQLAEEMVANMLPEMDIQATVEWVDEDRPTLWVSLTGHDADALVGPRARNLHSLQYLLRALLYHQSDGNYNVVVDADGYRKRRRRSLETMARAKADQAVTEGHMVRLRAMPPHERRIVHIILREDDRVTTESVGKGRERAVTIVPRTRSETR